MADSEELFSGHGWRITLDHADLPDGRVKRTARAHKPDAAHIIAFVDDRRILLLHEFRPHYGARVWMLPSGRIDKETNVAEGAMRELQEETGFRARELAHFRTANYSEGLKSQNHFFVARGLEHAPLPQDEDELIEVHTMEVLEALNRVLHDPNEHMPSSYALLRYLREQGR